MTASSIALPFDYVGRIQFGELSVRIVVPNFG